MLFRVPSAQDNNNIENGTILSRREQEVLSLVGDGFQNKNIADELCISEETVKAHMRNIFVKLHAHNRQQAVKMARDIQQG